MRMLLRSRDKKGESGMRGGRGREEASRESIRMKRHDRQGRDTGRQEPRLG